jgi:hypothetical protein
MLGFPPEECGMHAVFDTSLTSTTIFLLWWSASSHFGINQEQHLIKLVGSWFAKSPGTCKHHLEKVRLATHHRVPSNSISVTVSGLTFLFVCQILSNFKRPGASSI